MATRRGSQSIRGLWLARRVDEGFFFNLLDLRERRGNSALRWPSRFSPQGGKEHALLEGCRVNVCRLMQHTVIDKVFLVTFPTAAWNSSFQANMRKQFARQPWDFVNPLTFTQHDIRPSSRDIIHWLKCISAQRLWSASAWRIVMTFVAVFYYIMLSYQASSDITDVTQSCCLHGSCYLTSVTSSARFPYLIPRGCFWHKCKISPATVVLCHGNCVCRDKMQRGEPTAPINTLRYLATRSVWRKCSLRAKKI